MGMVFARWPGVSSIATPYLAAAALLAAGMAAPRAARADSFVETYLNPGVTSVTASTVCSVSNCAIGTETFNSDAAGDYAGKTLTTDFGTGGQITGTIAGNFQIDTPNQYGGASGNYAVTFDHNSGYSVTLSNAANGGGGVNYFGMELSALDPGNNLAFYNGNTLVATYTPQDLINALGKCPNGYCGNPSAPYKGQDPNEQFAFVNFYDQTGTFNRIVFTEGKNFGGGYEADNFTVAYRTNTSTTSGNVVPAPLPAPGGTPLGALVLAAAGLLHRRLSWRRIGTAAA